MATVYKSKTLLEDIKNVVNTMKYRERNLVPEMPQVRISNTDPRFINEFFNEAPHLAAEVPNSWLYAKESIGVNVTYLLVPDNPASDTRVHFNVMPVAGQKFFMPYSRTSGYIQADLTRWPEFAPGIAKLQHDFEVNKKWDDVYRKVSDFLSSFDSLNAAIKQWPGLSMYIPKEYLDRLERKVTRAKKEAPVIDVDTSELTAMAAANRMGI